MPQSLLLKGRIMAADERNQGSDGFAVLGLLGFWVCCLHLIGWPLALLYKFVLVPGAFDLSAFIIESVSP